MQDNYPRVALSSISIIKEERQRKDFVTDDLDASVRLRGVLVPIIIEPRSASHAPGTQPDSPYILVAGERRYTSSLKNGLLDIPARLISDLTPVESKIIELEENVKRQDLSWRDFVCSVAQLHHMHKASDPDWTRAATAAAVCIDPSIITQVLRVYRDIDSPRIAGCTGYRAAYNILLRQDERMAANIEADLTNIGFQVAAEKLEAHNASIQLDAKLEEKLTPEAKGQLAATPVAKPIPEPTLVIPRQEPRLAPCESIICADFHEWAQSYEGLKFNFLHCDFPYGIDVFGGEMSGRGNWETYNDSPDIYWDLIKTLCANLDRLMAPSAHLMFWFSMEYYHETLEAFRELAPELNFNLFPLVWTKSDNVGILPDPKRGPRRIYETALIASRGDRLVVQPVSNSYPAPTDKSTHHSAKPIPVLKHFFRMFVDEHSRVLDPTCGSGNALRAAESMGAEFVFGLEKSAEYANAAGEALRRQRILEGKR